MVKMESVDGFLHVEPHRDGADAPPTRGIIQATEGGGKPEVGDEVTYVSTRGEALRARVLEYPGLLKDGFAYIRTLNTPERLRGFVAELGGVIAKNNVLLEHAEQQEELNALHGERGEVKEFVPPNIPDDVAEAYNQSLDQIRRTHKEDLRNKNGNEREFYGAEMAIMALRAEDKLREAGDREDTKKSLALWREIKNAGGRGLRVGLLATALLATSLIPGNPHEPFRGFQVASAETSQTVTETREAEQSLKEYEIHPDAIVRKGEGVSHAFARQLKENPELADALHYDGTPSSLAKIMKQSGYMGGGQEVRVAVAGSAYQLEINADGDVGVAVYGPDGTLAGHRVFQQEQKTDLEHFEYKH
mgnify:CR=1 FL=1